MAVYHLASSDGSPPPPDGERRRIILRLAQNVATARKHAGLTQAQLAQIADLSRATVHLIEAGACDPKLSTVTSLAAALGRPAMSLLQDGLAEVAEASAR